uniref:Putative secreted protein n=2 Tax=Ixodes ricinus TaxID=34613 RepID=V5HEB8_IXORI
MCLALLLLVQLCTTVLGSKTRNDFKTTVPLNGTCNASMLKVTEHFRVLEHCFMSCKESANFKDVPNERLCNVAAFGTEESVKYTGKCINGTCQPPGERKYPVCFGYETMDIKGEAIATECQDSCFNSNHQLSNMNLPDGQKCVYPKKFSFLTLFRGPTVGICKDGTCTEKRTTNETCERNVLTVSSGVNIDASCTLSCKNKTTKVLKNGTQCVLRSTIIRKWPRFWHWTRRVDVIGVCWKGQCIQRELYNASQHDSKNGCNRTDIFIHQNLTVASNCRADCSNGTVEYRKDGLLCLWQYLRKELLDFFNIGNCSNGICKFQDDYVVVVKR